jgi:hypothetical protein
LLGVSIPLGLSAFHGAATAGVWPYFEAVVWFRLTSGGETDFVSALITGWGRAVPVWLPLALLAYAARTPLARAPRSRAFVLMWLGTSFVGMAMGGNWFLHYFQQLLPPLCVLAALGLGNLAQTSSGGRSHLVVAGAVALLAFWLFAPFVRLSGEDGLERIYGSDGYRFGDEAGAYVASITSADDEVLVVLSHASLVQATGRLSSSPYLYAQQVLGLDGVLDAMVREIEAGAPAVVVVSTRQLEHMRLGSRFRPFVERSYEFDRSIGGYQIWVRSSGGGG